MPVYESHYCVKSESGRMYSIDFTNDNSKFARFAVNGKSIIPTKEDEDAVVRAFTALDTAIANMTVNRVKIEEAFRND